MKRQQPPKAPAKVPRKNGANSTANPRFNTKSNKNNNHDQGNHQHNHQQHSQNNHDNHDNQDNQNGNKKKRNKKKRNDNWDPNDNTPIQINVRLNKTHITKSMGMTEWEVEGTHRANENFNTSTKPRIRHTLQRELSSLRKKHDLHEKNDQYGMYKKNAKNQRVSNAEDVQRDSLPNVSVPGNMELTIVGPGSKLKAVRGTTLHEVLRNANLRTTKRTEVTFVLMNPQTEGNRVAQISQRNHQQRLDQENADHTARAQNDRNNINNNRNNNAQSRRSRRRGRKMCIIL